MARIVRKQAPARQPYPIQVRPQPEVREKLRQAADAAGRTLNREMELRLAASVHGDHVASDLYPGWRPEDQLLFRSFGNVLGLLCARLLLTYGTGAKPQDLLKELRVAVAEFFTALGTPSEVSESDKFNAMIARQLLAEIRRSSTLENPSGEKAALAEFAAAWGLKE